MCDATKGASQRMSPYTPNPHRTPPVLGALNPKRSVAPT
jgi:hypothetical protein